MPDRPGYRVEACLGSGYYADVFRVVDLGSGRAYAAKVYTGDPAGVEAAAREAEALRALSHRRVPALRETFDQAGWPIVVMELVPGRNLRAEVAARGPLALARTLELAIEACELLEHVAARGWTYRDLHPKNIHPSTPRGVMLLDFDGARPPGWPARPAGRIGYRAPELDGDGPVSPACDLYSLAGCVHFALTGDDPTERPGALPERPGEPSPRPALAELLAACRRPDPTSRPPIASVRSELERLRDGVRDGPTGVSE
ncbi:MAG TPA: protein kinase [Chloroflexota bacterium]